jgi:hypothetical protein
MSETPDDRDRRLVELLDDALGELRQGGPVDPHAWGSRHPDLGDEAPGLLETLAALDTAAGLWRVDPAGEETPQKTTGPVEAARAADEAAPGPVFGRYQVLGRVGQGGMGTVYRAFDPELRRVVAVKAPRFDTAGEDAAGLRFLREARAAARVRHAHVCPVHDVGEQDGRPFVVMAFVEGESLADRLRRGPLDDPRQAVRLVRQAAEGLAAVHAEGILHRDIKPGNILLDRAGDALLTDFGLARPEHDGEALTAPGALVGTPAYMAPEQVQGQTDAIGPLSDVYGLGVVLYQAVSGRTPFVGPALSLMHQITNDAPPPPSRFRPGLDPELERLILRVLARRPEDRPGGARALADALAAWERGAGQAPEDQTGSATANAPPRRPRPTRRAVAAAVGLLAAAAVVAGVAWGLRGRPAGDGPGVGQPAAEAEAPLVGELSVTIWGDSKPGLSVDRAGALPARNGEMVHFKAAVNRPAYLYLLWLGSDGEAQPLYPWDPKRGFADTPAAERRTEAHTPPELDRGWELTGPGGLETALLLARSTPLPAGVDLAALIGKEKPARLHTPTEVAWLELGPDRRARQERVLHRGLNVAASKKIDEPMLNLLERLRPHFELLKAVRFAHQP